MFPPVPPSDVQQYAHPRRRPPAYGRSSGWNHRTSDLDYATGNLELSCHWPSSPFSNRYDLLAPLPSARTAQRDRNAKIARSQRRTRNSTRGSKEGKRLRNARRCERKWAAFLLDEQFSMQVDQTLRRANIQPTSLQYPPPIMPYVPTKPQPSNALVRYTPPPSPPQLPAFDFSRFEARDFPHVTNPIMSAAPPVLPIQTKTVEIPSWCPPLPCLRRDRVNLDDCPIFFDLSSLPEPRQAVTPPANPCQLLQLWRDNDLVSKPKQSRFFPCPPPSTPTVRLPRTSCRLHESDDGVNDTQPRETSPAPEQLLFNASADVNEQKCDSTKTRQEDIGAPTAANLWQILTSTRLDQSNDEEKLSNLIFRPLRGDEEYSPAAVDNALAELDGKEIPYVHANSLVGHANELAARHADQGNLTDSMALLASAFVLAAEDFLSKYETYRPEMNSTSTQTDPQVTSQPSPLLLSELPGTSVTSLNRQLSTPDVDLDDAVEVDAHYISEQELFRVPKLPSPAESLCDLDTFLKMGHVENCWCRDCDEAPTLVDEDHLTEDDGWMVWSSVDDESTQTSEATTNDAEVSASSPPHKTTPSWEDYFPCTPRRPVQEVEDDDFEDADFDHLDDEYDWCWNF